MSKNSDRLVKKKFLSRYIELKQEIETQAEEAGYWKEIAQSVSSLSLENYGIRSATRKDPITEFLDIAAECTRLGEKAIKLKREVEEVIKSVEDPLMVTILELRYINGYRFYEIAKKLNYSMQGIFTNHRRALDEIKLPKDCSKL